MALFVFGAGATRGCSFVDPNKFACLPPLDRDFFTQLQRVSNSKHRTLVRQVMRDVVELFGFNFDVTMETVFTTLEHNVRMLKATGIRWDFSSQELKEKRDRLEQAIAAVLEESLTETAAGAGSLSPRECTYHAEFVSIALQPRDVILTFNYDCLLDFALKRYGAYKWNARYGYGFNLGKSRDLLSGDNWWQPTDPAPQSETVNLFKLHGSLHFQISTTESPPQVTLKQRPYTKQSGTKLKFSIIPPEWLKQFDSPAFSRIWSQASNSIHQTRHIILVGYSLPPTDLHSTALFRTSVRRNHLRSVVVVNPDRETRKRTRAVLQRGLTENTVVLSFDSLPELLAIDRAVWEV
jgi:hypothetical protein